VKITIKKRIVLAFLIASVFAGWQGASGVYAIQPGYFPLYYTANPVNLSLSGEPNPGNVTDAEVLPSDSLLTINPGYFSVTSNVDQRQIWVNTMAVSKYVEKTPDGSPITLGIYECSFYTRIPPNSPSPSFNMDQVQNGECIDFDIILYDGRNEFERGSKRRIEAAGTWKLNPWDKDHNKILMRTTGGEWVDKGFYIPFDRRWHKITFTADFDREILLSVSVDGRTKYYYTPLWIRESPEWGDEVAMWSSLGSCSLYPQYISESDRTPKYIFWWQQDFRDFIWKNTR
jgi:hypothetical protein